MLAAVLIAAEISFWVLLFAGLWSRYRLGHRRLGAVLLALTPAVDLVVLVASVADLRGGATASGLHGLAAVYIGVSIAFGPRIVAWADARFAHRFTGAPPPPRPPRAGAEHARRERAGWYGMLAYAIGAGLLLGRSPLWATPSEPRRCTRCWRLDARAGDRLPGELQLLAVAPAKPGGLLGLGRAHGRVLDVAVAVR